MVVCTEDKIKNPISNKCVSIKGVTGKMLIKDFINGKIVLAPENVKKIGMSQKNATPQILKKKVILKKSVIETKKSPISIPKTISQNSTTQLESQSSSAKHESIKKSVNETKKSPVTTLKKTVSLKKKIVLKKSVIDEKNKSLVGTPLNKDEIPKNVKDKIHNFVEDWKKRKERKINDEDYNLFCKTKKLEDLKKPIVNMSLTIEFPVASMVVPVGFSIESLNSPSQKFIYNKITGVQITFNNYSLRHLLYKGQNDTVKYFEDLVDKTWLSQMNKYISGLSTKDLYTLVAYTHYGDVIANNFLRNKLKKEDFVKELAAADKWLGNYYPLFFQALDKLEKTKNIKYILKDGKDPTLDTSLPYIKNVISHKILPDKILSGKMLISDIFNKLSTIKNLKISEKYSILYLISRYLDYDKFWKGVIEQYIKDLDNLIDNSPPITKRMIVYRGVKNDYFLTGTKDHIYKTDSFVSTSINLPSAMKFAGNDCCFKRITLLPGTKTLLLAGISKYKNEIELLLGTNAQFYITKEKNTIPRLTTDICNDGQTGKIIVTDMVIVK